MKTAAKLFTLSAFTALSVSSIANAKNWWEEDRKYKVEVTNIEPMPNGNPALVLFFKDTTYKEGFTPAKADITIPSIRPKLGEPAPNWLKTYLDTGAKPDPEEDLCIATEVTLGEVAKIKTTLECLFVVVVQKGRDGDESDPVNHFNALFGGQTWVYKAGQFGEGYNLGDPEPGYIFSQALVKDGAATVKTLKLSIQTDYSPDKEDDDKE